MEREAIRIEIDGIIEVPTRMLGVWRWAFLEAKTTNALTERDFERLRSVVDLAPGAACVVATLRPTYSETEKTELRALAEYAARSHGLLIPLTEREILTRPEWTLEFPSHMPDEAAAHLRRHIAAGPQPAG